MIRLPDYSDSNLQYYTDGVAQANVQPYLNGFMVSLTGFPSAPADGTVVGAIDINYSYEFTTNVTSSFMSPLMLPGPGAATTQAFNSMLQMNPRLQCMSEAEAVAICADIRA